MLLRLCQLKSQVLIGILLLTLGGCSLRKEKPVGSELLQTFKNEWFFNDPFHTIVGSDGIPVPHVLFDTTPEFNDKAQTVNVIIATPQDSQHVYQIDLNSGQRYFSHSLCKQKDIWHKYSGTIHRPQFAIGYIPRVLDQLGMPQKIIVWSNRSRYGSEADFHAYKVKIVGAYVEQICPEGNCIGKSNWLSRMVFVGVDADDTSMPQINNITEFKNTIKWDESKAQLENVQGKNFIGSETYPYVQVGQLIEYKEAFNFFKKWSIFMTDKELGKIQSGCQALYKKLWQSVGKERREDLPSKTKEELKAKIKHIEELKKKRMPVGFAARLKKFTKEYFDEITTCERFVYHGNINNRPDIFWFFSYMSIYYQLHRDGYHYNCQLKAWQRNVLNHDGKPTYNLKRDIDQCSEREFDLAMEYLPNFLTSLKNEKEYYQFIEYDNHPFGTHKKMYSWVKMRSTKFDCSKDPNDEIKKELNVYPSDVRWKARFFKDQEYDTKIIY